MTAAVLLGAVGCGAGPSDAPSTATTTAPAVQASSRGGTPTTAGDNVVGFRRALERGARDGLRLGVRVSAAIWSSKWREPQTLDGGRPLRWWSMAKPVTALAVLQQAAEQGSPVSPQLSEAMERAIRRSENCPQRRVVLELQHRAGGEAAARARLAEIFARIGVAQRVQVTHQSQRAQPGCLPYLEASSPPGGDTAAPALLLGTSTWTPSAAAAFARGLASDTFGEPGARVLTMMRGRKLRSREQLPGDYTAALDWGAGRAFRGWSPAYKSGWGGASAHRFMAGQIVALRLSHASYGIAVMARPLRQQPSVDDPGLTGTPQAVEAVLRRLRTAIEATSAH